jgi:chromosome segregation ATPase
MGQTLNSFQNLPCDICPTQVRTVGAAGLDDPSVYKAKVDEIEAELRAVRDRYTRLAAEHENTAQTHESVIKERDMLRVRYHEALAKLEHLGASMSQHNMNNSWGQGAGSTGKEIAERDARIQDLQRENNNLRSKIRTLARSS